MLKILILNLLVCLVLADLGILYSDTEKRAAYSSNVINGNFLYQGVKRNPGKIVATAAYPLSVAVASLALFAKGETYNTILKYLDLKNEDEIRQLFPAINKATFENKKNGSPTITFRVYTDENNKFCSAFKYEFNKTFGGATRIVDYSDPEAAADDINNEVKSEGSGEFEDLISSDMITKGPGLHFISTFELAVIYDKRFQLTTKTTINFKSGDKITKLPAKTGEGIIKYADNKYLDAKIVQLLGEGGDYTYLIVYPNKSDGLIQVLDKLREPALFAQILEQGEEVCGKVTTLVKNDYIHKIDLKKSAVESNYLKGFFQKGGLKLCGVTRNCTSTYISSVLHEIHLKRKQPTNSEDEGHKCSKYSVELETNHPFLYYVTFTKNVALFRTPIMGVVVDINK